LLALEKTGTDPKRCIVVEDSRNGMLAGYAADINVLVTTSIYTCREDFSESSLVVSCLGDSDGELGKITSGSIAEFIGVLSLTMVGSLVE
jgi:beta-phosphoglucomutase-like phosphatase (HAD superfamily)